MHRYHAMVRAHVKEVLERSGIFPPHAVLAVREGDDNAVLIHCEWLLATDPEQADCRATPVEITLHGQVADRYRNANFDTLNRLDMALARRVARRMERYQADHGLPYHRPPPAFEIRINDLDGRSHSLVERDVLRVMGDESPAQQIEQGGQGGRL